jgi:hypothetical protein
VGAPEGTESTAAYLQFRENGQRYENLGGRSPAHPYKSSWYLYRADREKIDELRRRFKEAGPDVHVILLRPTGDTANDSAMFLVPGVHGIVVENAQPELFEAVVKPPTFVPRKVMADGVPKGLKYFGVVPDVPAPRRLPPTQRYHAAWQGMLFWPDAFRTLSTDDRALIANGLPPRACGVAEECHAVGVFRLLAREQHGDRHGRQLSQRLGA